MMHDLYTQQVFNQAKFKLVHLSPGYFEDGSMQEQIVLCGRLVLGDKNALPVVLFRE